MTKEEWRPIEVEHNPRRRTVLGWEVSNLGRVRSIRQGGGHYILSACQPSPNDTSSYPYVRVAGRKRYIHQLVAKAFLPPPAEGQTLVLHRDGDDKNFRADNLAWGNRRENAIEALRHGSRTTNLDPHSVSAIRGLRRRHNMSVGELAVMFGVHRHAILNVLNYTTWSHIP